MKHCQQLLLDIIKDQNVPVDEFVSWVGTQDAFYEDNAEYMFQLMDIYNHKKIADKEYTKPYEYSVYRTYTIMTRSRFCSVMRVYRNILNDKRFERYVPEFKAWYEKYYELEMDFWKSDFPKQYFYSEYEGKISQGLIDEYRQKHHSLEKEFPFYKSILEIVKFE